LSILVIIAVTLIIMRETREVVAIASAIHPLFGQVSFGCFYSSMQYAYLFRSSAFCDFQEVFSRLRQEM
jgi:hypothetical protein